MSNRALIAAVLVALGLVGLLFMLNKQPSPAAGTPAGPGGPSGQTSPTEGGDRLLALGEGEVSIISRIDPAGSEDRVTRAAGGGWMFTRHPAGGATASTSAERGWPVLIPSEIVGALTRLREVRADPAAGATALGDVVGTVRLRAGPSSVDLRVGASSLGGRTPVQVGNGPIALIDDPLIRPFIDPGPAAWRLPSALPGVSRASRITIATPSGALGFAKVDGQWSVRRPVNARASEAAVASLVSALDSILITFVEAKPDPVALGFDRARFTASIEIDERQPQDGGRIETRVETRELIVGAPARADGSVLYAASDSSAGTVFTLPASALTAISTSPRAYLAPTATGVNPERVGAITLRRLEGPASERVLRRAERGWRTAASTAPRPSEDEAATRDAVNELLELLTARAGEPDPVPIDAATASLQSLRALARVELSDAEGVPLDLLTVGYTADGVLGVRAAGVVVLYPGVQPPAILELPSFASLPAEPDGPGPATITMPAPTK